MARGYLGKISAVVSANTGSYVRGLNESAARTRDFAREVQSTLRRASSEASKSIQAIYTPLQQFERALQNASSLKLSFKGFPGAIKTVEELQTSLAKLKDSDIDIAVRTSGLRSLDELKRTISQISSKDIDFVRNTGGLDAVKRLRAELGSVDNFVVKTEVKVRAEQLDAVIEKFAVIDDKQIDAVINVVGERQLEATLLKERQLRSIADGLSAPLSDAVSKFAQLSSEVQAAFVPALSRAQTGVQNMTDEAEAGVEISRRKFKELEEQVNLTTSAINRLAQANQLVARLGEGGGLRDAAPRQFDALNRAGSLFERGNRLSGMERAGFGIAGQEDAVRSYARQIEQMRAMRERLAAEQSDTSQIDAAITRTTQRLEEEEAALERLIAAAERYKKIQSTEFVTFPGNPDGAFGPPRPFNSTPGNPDGEFGPPRPFSPVNPQQQFLGRVGGEITAVRNQLRELPGVAAELGPAVDNLTTRWQNLARAGVGVTAEQLQRVRKETQDVQAALNSRREIASGFSSQFGGAGAAGIGVGIDERKLRAIGSEFDFLQGKIAGVTGGVRGPLVAAMERYRAVSTRAFREGTISTTQGQRAIARARDEVVRLAAALLNVKPGRLAEQLKRVGDVARGSFGNASLAIQQAAFAVDDFFSVTGGLDQRIRAAGNNISQLGFLVGGTAGLIAGISISIGSQLVASLIKWYTAGNTVEDQQKRLKDRLDAVNASIERQKSLTEQLASAYKSLGESIASIGLSEQGRTFQGRRRQIADIQESQRQRRVEIVEQTDAGIARRRERIASLEQRLETEPREAVRARLRETIRAIEKTIEARLKQFEADADILINRATVTARRFRTTPEAELRARRGQVQGELESARRVVDTLGADNAPRWVEKIDKLSGELAALEVALQKLTDAVGTDASRSAFRVADQLGRSQERLSEIPGFTNVEQAANQLSTKLESLVASLGEADSRELAASILKQIEALQKQAAAVERTSIALESFSAALERAAGNLARTVESELASTAESLRRRANAAEAEFGRNDPRTIEARRDAGQIEAARRRATENRQQIEAELSAQRQKFEADAAAGVGNREAAEISERLRQLSEIQSSETASASQKEAARLESDRLQTRLNEIFNELPKVQELRRRADLGDVEAQRQIQDIESRARGRELAKTPAQRAAEQAAKDATDLQAEFERRAARNPFEAEPRDPAEIERERVAAFNRLAEQQAQQVAPLLAGFRDERLNAALQGPSRAALNVADTQTVEGSRELNRLLRGDDPNKDVNLVELQKQSDLLQGVIDAIEKQAGPGVVEIRG